MKLRPISSSLAALFASGSALVCPLCPSAATALLASIGVSGLAAAALLKPLLAAFLAVALAGLTLGYRRHRRPWPLALALPGALAVYGARWLVSSAPLLYGGIGLLLAASVADALAQRRVRPCCEAAASQTAGRSRPQEAIR